MVCTRTDNDRIPLLKKKFRSLLTVIASHVNMKFCLGFLDLYIIVFELITSSDCLGSES